MDKRDKQNNALDRRRFVARTGAAALGFEIMRPGIAFGSTANSKVRLGLIGCGGRGTWIARLFLHHGGYTLAAVADYFQEAADRCGDEYEVPKAKRFTGLSGYKRLLESGVDAIAVESPPYFHPGQAEAGVDAGVHVYLAKPIAVDVPGCRTVEESGKKARQKKQCFQVDFQTRADPYYIEALKRVHSGEIGEMAFGEATYHAGSPWKNQFQFLRDDPENPENRLRAWGLCRVLSGDIITEQNIHTLDVASWILDRPPVQALGTCALKVRESLGSCNDCFTIVYEYPNSVGISFSSRQFEGHGSRGGIRNRMFGSKGVLETEYGGDVLIRGEKPYEGGKSPKIFTDGAVQNIATFHRNILERRYENNTVKPSVRSNLVTVLGRTAAYKKGAVRWDELMENPETLEADLRGLKD